MNITINTDRITEEDIFDLIAEAIEHGMDVAESGQITKFFNVVMGDEFEALLTNLAQAKTAYETREQRGGDDNDDQAYLDEIKTAEMMIEYWFQMKLGVMT